MLFFVAGQNLIAYTVNMADNVMLGSYMQTAFSGVSIVNQIFFVLQQITIGISNALVVLTAQYWGQKRADPMRVLTGKALIAGFFFTLSFTLACTFFPERILRLFTADAEIIAEGLGYLSIIRWTFIIFTASSTFMAVLRSAGTVNISFYISIVSLVVNVAINYTLIFGNFGFPEMGARGAAVGTLIARILELAIVVVYAARFDEKLHLFKGGLFMRDASLMRDYLKVAVPVVSASILWALSVPIQTGILGRLSSDAIAANSVSSTFYQYLKVIVVAMSSVSGVVIGNAVGRGDIERVKSDARTLSVVNVLIGIVLSSALYLMRYPLLSRYNLTESATELSLRLIALMSFIMLTMSYQMPVSSGILQGAGDTKFRILVNLISMWGITMPLSFMAAFWWKLPVIWVVLCIQSDQIYKCIPIFIRFCSYKWIKKLTN